MPEDDDFLDGYEPAPPGTFLDLNGTAVGDIQRLGKFLREEFHDGDPIKKHAIDEAILRLRELKKMRYYKAIVDELDEETRSAATHQAHKRGVMERLGYKKNEMPDDIGKVIAKLFSEFGF